MSQKLVLELLVELGGRATTAQLVAKAKEKHPGSCIIELMTDRLNKLHKWGEVNYDHKTKMWQIPPQAAAAATTAAVVSSATQVGE